MTTPHDSTFNDFWNDNDIYELFLAGFGFPGGQTLVDTTGDDMVDDEAYCDLADCLLAGLIHTVHDGEDFTGYGDLEGEVSDDGKSWSWNGKKKAWDVSGNDYYQIKLVAR